MVMARGAARTVLTIVVAFTIVWIALLAIERSGPRPVHAVNISKTQSATVHAGARSQPVDVTTTKNNPNAGCKPKPPHDCRPPSGN